MRSGQVFDVYDRETVAVHWPADVQTWARQALADGVPVYGAPLNDAQALDWWLPLPWLSLAAEHGVERERIGREDFAGVLGVILLWRDGTLYAGVPPRRREDLLHLYWANRLIVDAYQDQGRALALADWAPPPSHAAPN